MNGEDAVARIDVAEQKLVDKVAVGAGPVQVYVSPNGRYLLVANQGTPERPSTTVSIIDTATFKVVRTIETGQGAHGVVIDPSGRHAYVTNIYGNDVAVVDLAEQKVVATVRVREKPNGISFSTLVPATPPAATVELPLPKNDEPGEDMEMK